LWKLALARAFDSAAEPATEPLPMTKRLVEGDPLTRRAEELSVNIASGEMINIAGNRVTSAQAISAFVQQFANDRHCFT
jgi:hypothetical protein